MEPIINAKNTQITPKLRTYCEKKTERLDRYMPDVAEVRVDLSESNAKSAKSRHVAQITVRDGGGTILRAEERAADFFAAIDMVMDKIYRQIKRYRGKSRARRRSAPTVDELLLLENLEPLPLEDEPDDELDGTVVRTKRFEMQPMSADEAIDQMELLGHDFYMFFNIEDESYNVIYKRRDQSYGLLQPELM